MRKRKKKEIDPEFEYELPDEMLQDTMYEILKFYRRGLKLKKITKKINGNV